MHDSFVVMGTLLALSRQTLAKGEISMSPVVPQMRLRLLSVFLIATVCAHALSQQPQPTPQRSTAQTDKIAAKILKIGIRADVTVKLHNGKTYHGFINRIDDEQFEMSEVDLKTNVDVRYDQVKTVERGYAEKGPLGNRVGRRRGMIIAVAAAAGLGVLMVIGVKDH
jgi:hypothetical protein